MALPIIQFKATNTELTGDLQELMEQKLQTLERFIKNETDLKCEVEFEKVAAHNSGEIYRAEVNFYKDGKLFRAESTEDSFEKAIDEVRSELDKEMRRDRKKSETLMKRGGRKIKEMIRFGR